jgi:hypothetical protein
MKKENLEIVLSVIVCIGLLIGMWFLYDSVVPITKNEVVLSVLPSARGEVKTDSMLSIMNDADNYYNFTDCLILSNGDYVIKTTYNVTPKYSQNAGDTQNVDLTVAIKNDCYVNLKLENLKLDDDHSSGFNDFVNQFKGKIIKNWGVQENADAKVSMPKVNGTEYIWNDPEIENFLNNLNKIGSYYKCSRQLKEILNIDKTSLTIKEGYENIKAVYETNDKYIIVSKGGSGYIYCDGVITLRKLDNVILSVKHLYYRNSNGYGSSILDMDKEFVGKKSSDIFTLGDSGNIDGVTGATHSSNSIIEAVNNALSYYNNVIKA